MKTPDSKKLFQLDVWDKKNNLFLSANNEDQPDRKRSASLIAYTDKEKKKAPGLDQFQMERQKVELREVYNRNNKVTVFVWIAGFQYFKIACDIQIPYNACLEHPSR